MTRRQRGDTRREILNTAEHLLQVRGFNGFSYQHIAAQLGIRNAAVHYHFPSKADLGVAIIRRFREEFSWWHSQLDSKELTAAARMESFLDLERRYVAQHKVCPLGVVGVEYDGVPPSMREETRALLEEVVAWLGDVLEQARQDGTMICRDDIDTVARQVMATVQGALQLSRLQDEAAFEAVMCGLRSSLGMSTTDAAARAAG